MFWVIELRHLCLRDPPGGGGWQGTPRHARGVSGRAPDALGGVRTDSRRFRGCQDWVPTLQGVSGLGPDASEVSGLGPDTPRGGVRTGSRRFRGVRTGSRRVRGCQDGVPTRLGGVRAGSRRFPGAGTKWYRRCKDYNVLFEIAHATIIKPPKTKHTRTHRRELHTISQP